MPCSFSLSPQVWCSTPQTVLKPPAEICLSSLMCFLYLWVGVVVFWMWSDEYRAGQPSLLSAGCSPAHTAEETAGLCCQCTLLAHTQLHTHQDFSLACFPARSSLYCVFLPKCRTRLFSLLNFRRFLLLLSEDRCKICLLAFFSSWGPVLLLSKVPLASERHWMQPATEAWRTFVVKTGIKKA